MRKRALAVLCLLAGTGVVSGPLAPRVSAASTLCSTPQVQGISVQPPGSGQLQQQHAPAGSLVTVTGTGFQQAFCNSVVVSFLNTNPLVSFTLRPSSSTQFQFTSQAGMSGQLSVADIDTNGQQTNADSHLVYITDPTATGLSNATPNVSSSVTINGGGFNFNLPAGWETSSAAYGWTAPGTSGGCAGSSSQASLRSNTQIALVMPAQYCDGQVTVTLGFPLSTASNAPRDSVTVKANFDINPVVSGLSRSDQVPGGAVTINGTGLGNQGGTVTLNGEAASVSGWNDTGITFTVPGDASSGGVILTRRVDGKPFSAGNLGVDAHISSLSPAKAPVGATVTASGAGFGSQAGSVSIGSTQATVSSWSGSSVAFTVPDGAVSGPVTITTNGTNPPPAVNLQVIPRITGVTPSHAQVGSLIEIDGTTFGTQQGTVTVGGESANVTLWGDKQVLVNLPSALSPGSTTIALTPPGNDAATAAYTIDVPPPTPAAQPSNGGSGSSSSSGSASSPGASPTPGLIPPSPGGPVIAHGPVNFVKPPPPPGPVSLQLATIAGQSNPGTTVAFTVTLQAFGKPVVGAPVDLLMVIEPGSDAAVDPSHAVTDAQGQVHGVIHLSKTPGDHIVLARSGIYSDETRVVGRSAAAEAAASTHSKDSGSSGGLASVASPFLSVRTPVLWALALCVVLFGLGFGLNLATAPVGEAAMAGPRRGVLVSFADGARCGASLGRFAVALVALAGAQVLGVLRGRSGPTA